MCILAIDTSDLVTYVAVLNHDKKIVSNCGVIDEQASHNEELSTLTQKTLSEAKCDFADLTTLIVGSGPGSFTGLRIGYGFIKGLAVGLRQVLVQQCSFDAAFYEFYRSGNFSHNLKTVHILSDARRGQCFKKTFFIESGEVRSVSTVELSEIELAHANQDTAIVLFRNLELDNKADYCVKNISIGHLHLYSLNLGSTPQQFANSFDLNNLSKLNPNYIRPINAQTIAERNNMHK